MRNYALPRGPCNFLNLRTSPWESSISPPLFFFSLALLFSSTDGISLSLSCPFLSSTQLGAAYTRRPERAVAAAGRAAPGDGADPGGAGAWTRRHAVRARRRSGAAWLGRERRGKRRRERAPSGGRLRLGAGAGRARAVAARGSWSARTALE
jgi:hypothetical protein